MHQTRFLIRLLRMLAGLFLFAVGIVMTINANIGLAPWDVFHQGLSNVLGITMGQASIIVGVVVVGVDFFAGERIGWGTLGNMVFIGLFIDFLMLNNLIPEMQLFIAGVFQMVAGLFVIGIASVLYIGAGMGCGPRDGLMVALLKKTGRSVSLIRGILEGGALVCGWLLGGTVGLGTVITALLTGPMVQLAFRMLRFDVKVVQHHYIDQDIKALGKLMKSS
ncbi:MAG: hypothetical protein SCK57_00490 [Bacillota bacterium]|nr:hypothetical protein [Bacillota bacterium]MDW7676119.1 hypothetical protein [Bacillota bacterium]